MGQIMWVTHGTAYSMECHKISLVELLRTTDSLLA